MLHSSLRCPLSPVLLGPRTPPLSPAPRQQRSSRAAKSKPLLICAASSASDSKNIAVEAAQKDEKLGFAKRAEESKAAGEAPVGPASRRYSAQLCVVACGKTPGGLLDARAVRILNQPRCAQMHRCSFASACAHLLNWMLSIFASRYPRRGELEAAGRGGPASSARPGEKSNQRRGSLGLDCVRQSMACEIESTCQFLSCWKKSCQRLKSAC